jgi:hypothetical protein
MPALFDRPAPGAVAEQLDAYAAYLAERDGAPDFERRTLARRERAMGPLEGAAAAYDGPFDHAIFERQYARYDRVIETPPALALLLCFLKINANEAYGVAQVTARAAEKNDRVGRILRLVLLEETYHTRLLQSAGRLFGVEPRGASPPVAITRAIVAGIARLPDVASRPITLAGEAVGIATFLRMLGAVRRVFADRPVVRDALEARVTEVLVDEIGHLSFNRLAAEPATFAALRGILPAVALGTRGALPEAEQLGILPVPVHEVWNLDPRALPDEVRRRAFVA